LGSCGYGIKTDVRLIGRGIANSYPTAAIRGGYMELKAADNIIYSLADNVVLRKEKFGGLIIRKAHIDVYAINATGYHILNLCKQRSSEEIALELSKTFNSLTLSIETLENDVKLFLREAISSRLVKEAV
jgi:hypothetical protein